MGSNRDIGWDFAEPIGDSRKTMKCKFFQKVITGGITRLKEHIALVTENVERCTKAPKEVSRMLQKHIQDSKSKRNLMKRKKDVALHAIRQETPYTLDSENSSGEEEFDGQHLDHIERMESRQVRNAMRESRKTAAFEDEMHNRYGYGHVGAGSSHGPTLGVKRGISRSQSVKDTTKSSSRGIDPLMYPSKQKSIKNWFSPDKIKGVGKAISKWFIFNVIPFNAADSGSYYQSMINTIAEAGTGIQGLSGRQIGGIYLQEEVKETESYMSILKAKWPKYGCTIMCDGWSTRNKHPIINFMIYCDRDMIYHTSVDCTNKRKTADFLLSLMNKVIDEIGEENVVHVVTDSESANKSAGERLMQERPHLFWSPCAAHCVDLMLEDIGKMEKVKKYMDKAKYITSFIYNSDKVVNLMKIYTNDRELLRPGITRFATQFIAIESLLRHHIDLKRMCTTSEWEECNNTTRRRKEAEKVSKIILDARFWKKAREICAVMELLVKVLKLVDQDKKPTLSIIYEAMDRAKLAIKDGVKDWQLYWNVIDDRWYNQLHQHLHAAAYFLNPTLQYSATSVYTDEVRRGLKVVVKRLEPDLNSQARAMNEIKLFTNKMGEFGSPLALQAVKQTLPAEWWINYGEEAPHLRKIAIKVLSQTCSSSGCERNWSTWSLIHTKLRNRLAIEKLHKLVYCHYNMRLRVRNMMHRNDDDYYSPIDLNHIFDDDDILEEWTRENEQPILSDDILDSVDRVISQEEDDHATTSAPKRRNEERSRNSRGKNVASENLSDDSDDSDDSDESGDGTDKGNNGRSQRLNDNTTEQRSEDRSARNYQDDQYNAGMSWAQGGENYYATQDTDHGYRPGIEEQRRFLSSIDSSRGDHSYSGGSSGRYKSVDEQMQSLGLRGIRQVPRGYSYGSSNDNRIAHEVAYNPRQELSGTHGHFDGYLDYSRNRHHDHTSSTTSGIGYHGTNYGSSGGFSGYHGYDYSSGASGARYRAHDYGSSDSAGSSSGYRGFGYYRYHDDSLSSAYPIHSTTYNAPNQPSQPQGEQLESSRFAYPHGLYHYQHDSHRSDTDDFVPPRHSTWY